MTTAIETAPQVESMHLSLFVEEMAASVAFYEVLFGVRPTKNFDDYAKFDVENPPVVFSLQPRARRAGASLSHMGLRMKSPEQVLEVQRRLIDAGYKISRQDGVTCGYAVQSKCWVFDPDGNPWEIYVLERDVEPTSDGACISRLAPSQSSVEDSKIIQLDMAGSEQILLSPITGASGIQLRGWPIGGWSQLESYMRSVDVPRISWDLLVAAETGSTGDVPKLTELISAIARTGRFRVFLESIIPTQDGQLAVRMSLTKFGNDKNADQLRHVLYRGPMARMVDGNGRTWERGVRTPISESEWNELQLLNLAKHFSLAEDGAAPLCSTGD